MLSDVRMASAHLRVLAGGESRGAIVAHASGALRALARIEMGLCAARDAAISAPAAPAAPAPAGEKPGFRLLGLMAEPPMEEAGPGPRSRFPELDARDRFGFHQEEVRGAGIIRGSVLGAILWVGLYYCFFG